MCGDGPVAVKCIRQAIPSRLDVRLRSAVQAVASFGGSCLSSVLLVFRQFLAVGFGGGVGLVRGGRFRLRRRDLQGRVGLGGRRGLGGRPADFASGGGLRSSSPPRRASPRAWRGRSCPPRGSRAARRASSPRWRPSRPPPSPCGRRGASPGRPCAWRCAAFLGLLLGGLGGKLRLARRVQADPDPDRLHGRRADRRGARRLGRAAREGEHVRRVEEVRAPPAASASTVPLSSSPGSGPRRSQITGRMFGGDASAEAWSASRVGAPKGRRPQRSRGRTGRRP